MTVSADPKDYARRLRCMACGHEQTVTPACVLPTSALVATIATSATGPWETSRYYRMTAKSTTERMQALIARRKAAGLKEVRNVWVHPDDEAAVREYAAKLQRRRQRQEEKR